MNTWNTHTAMKMFEKLSNNFVKRNRTRINMGLILKLEAFIFKIYRSFYSKMLQYLADRKTFFLKNATNCRFVNFFFFSSIYRTLNIRRKRTRFFEFFYLGSKWREKSHIKEVVVYLKYYSFFLMNLQK